MDELDLSVVIPCLNAAAQLPRQLEAVARQRWRGTWEVVIADNGSTDDTRRVAESFAAKVPRLRVVDASSRRGRHHACNVGARHAAGRSIVFVDADDRIGAGYLEAMARGLQTASVVAARLDYSLDPEWMRGVGSAVQTDALQNGLGFLPFGGGGTLGFRKAVFDELGGLREHATYCEDVDLCWRAQLAGYEIAFVPDAAILYRSRPTLAKMYQQHRNYARAWPLLYREFRRAGMRRRSAREALSDWAAIVRAVPRLRSRTEAARWVRRTGRSVGRLEGSVRHRVWYP
jgi:glycosyltransferase involved in cell wall biosynthesis